MTRGRSASTGAPAREDAEAPRRKVPSQEWWRTEGGFFLLSEAHRAEEGPKAAAFLSAVLRLAPGSRVLDMGCGWGRVGIELAAQGHRVVGVDCSRVLRLARLLADQRGISADWVRGDMRRWTSRPVFDAALLWGMSFGYFSDEENVEVLRRIRSSLRPGGKLVMDLHHRDWYLLHYLGEHVELVQGRVAHDEASFDTATGRLNILSLVADGQGKVQARQWHSFREYTVEETVSRVRAAGLEVVEHYAALEPRARPLRSTDSSWQLVARRPVSGRITDEKR